LWLEERRLVQLALVPLLIPYFFQHMPCALPILDHILSQLQIKQTKKGQHLLFSSFQTTPKPIGGAVAEGGRKGIAIKAKTTRLWHNWHSFFAHSRMPGTAKPLCQDVRVGISSCLSFKQFNLWRCEGCLCKGAENGRGGPSTSHQKASMQMHLAFFLPPHHSAFAFAISDINK